MATKPIRVWIQLPHGEQIDVVLQVSIHAKDDDVDVLAKAWLLTRFEWGWFNEDDNAS
jgi:hypothetical protein